MEKTFQLDPNEQQTVTTMENDALRLNARYGVLSREMRDIESRITASEEQQRGFIRNALNTRGVRNFEAAQIVQGQLMCRLPDEPMPAPAPVTPEKLNGPAKRAHAQSE